MKILLLLALVLSIVLAAAQDKPAPYSIKGHQVEGCACDVYCPCIWQKDASADHCRALLGYIITDGSYGPTDLKGVSFAVAVTKTGKNLAKTMGSWEGVLYLPEGTSKERRDALVDILKRQLGNAFAHLDVQPANVEITREGDQHQLKVEKIALLKARPLKGGNGKVPMVENAPFSLTNPTYCAQAEVHTYDDGNTKWDFAGRNAFYGSYEYVSQ